MDPFRDPNTALAFSVWLLLLLLNARETIQLPLQIEADNEEDDLVFPLIQSEERAVCDTTALMMTTVQNFRLCTSLNVFHDEMTYWVKPRSTTWFSCFLVEQYDNSRWISMFRMTKPAVIALSEIIRPYIEKKNTKYRLAVPVLVRVACTLFKLTHGANFTICSEMFAIGRSTVCKILREVVNAINDCLRHEIAWPSGERMRETQEKFSKLCSLPAVVGAIDGVHFAISKPRASAADYYYFKSGGYSVNCQAVVDSDKRFLDIYVGMPGSTNDSRVLRRSSLYQLATHGNLLDSNYAVDGFSPYLIGDLGYPLLPWLIVPHRQESHQSISEAVFNRRLRRGRVVVENAFGILKQSFRELLGKSDLNLTFFPDVIMCCCILHNILMRQSHELVEEFLEVLQTEGLQPEGDGDEPRAREGTSCVRDHSPVVPAVEKRAQLGLYVTSRRRTTL